MLISAMEGRPDWKAIVESVICPTCSSPETVMCRNLGAAAGTLASIGPRNDWHQTRKESAVIAWEEFRNRPKAETPEVEAQGSGGDGWDTGFAQDGDPYGIHKEYISQSPNPNAKPIENKPLDKVEEDSNGKS